MSPAGSRTKTPSHCHLALRRYGRLCLPSSRPSRLRAAGEGRSSIDRCQPSGRSIGVLLVGERSGRVLSCRDTVSSSRDRPPSRKPFSWTAYPEEIIAAVKRGHPVRSALLGFQLRQQISFTLGARPAGSLA